MLQSFAAQKAACFEVFSRAIHQFFLPNYQETKQRGNYQLIVLCQLQPTFAVT
jgi:hypothetical protein